VWPFSESRSTIRHQTGMTLLPAERIGRRYLNPVPTQVGGLSIIFKIGPRFLFGAAARSPKQAPGPFHTDPRIYQTSPQSGLRVTWFGHSSSLVEIDGVRVLIDPVWDERAAPTQWAGPKRFFPPTLALEALPAIDAVLISHDHYDHLGKARFGVWRRWRTCGRRDGLPAGVGAILARFGVDAGKCTELNWMKQVKVGSLTITALPSRHFSDAASSIALRRCGLRLFLPVRSIASITGPTRESGPASARLARRIGPFDLTMLEIGAFESAVGRCPYGPEGAVRSFRALGASGKLMPIHWDFSIWHCYRGRAD